MPGRKQDFERQMLRQFQSEISPVVDRGMALSIGFLFLFSLLFLLLGDSSQIFGYLDLGFAVLAGITLLFRHRISVPVKIGIMMAFGGLLAVFGLSRTGFLGNAVSILMLIMVTSEILLKPRTTSLIGGLAVGAMIVVGILADTGVLVFDPDLIDRLTRLRYWVLQAVQLGLFFLISFYLVNYMRSRLLSHIRELTEANSTVEKIAYYDPLTGLVNRTRFRMDVKARMDRNGATGSMVLINIKGFRIVNSLAGQEKGDQLLVTVADILRECRPENSIIARQGADEFALWVEDLGDGDLNSMISRIQTMSWNRVSGEEYGHKLEVYTATARFPDQGDTFESCQRNAGLAMRMGKETGTTSLIRFNADMADRIESETRMRLLLERDIRSGSFDVHYQKRVDLKTGATVGVEALARWNPEELGPVGPDTFIPIVAKAEKVIPFGKMIFERILRDLPELRRVHGPATTVSVNVSPLFFLHPGFRDHMLAEVHRAGISPAAFVFEITEDVFIDDLDTVRDLIVRLEADGFAISMDDFGKGYSSLYYISNIPFSELKVDKSFIQSICTDERSFQLLQAICGIARTFGLKVVAEGVEIEQQIDRLKETTCDIVQGYYYSRPEALERIFVASNTGVPE